MTNALRSSVTFSAEPVRKMFVMMTSMLSADEVVREEKTQVLWKLNGNGGVNKLNYEDRYIIREGYSSRNQLVLD